jgi:predicted nuclease of predicted toxin-antitoxin system
VATLKLDENVPDSVGVILRQGGHDVALARDEQLTGVGDDRVLAVAAAEDRVLLSLDRDFTNILRHPPEATAGIVVIRLREQTLPLIRRVAATLCDVLSQESARGQLWVLDESRLRMWPRGGPTQPES